LPWSSRQSVPEQEASLRPDLLPRLGAFARLLHDAGLEAGPRRLTDATRALVHIDMKREVDFRSALRTVFVSRKEDIPTFEAACARRGRVGSTSAARRGTRSGRAASL